MSNYFVLLAFLPLLILVLISLWKGVTYGVYISFVVTSVLFFVWESTIAFYFASIFSALVSTINILTIIFGAVFLYQVMEQKEFIKGIETSLVKVHPDKTFRFYFLAFFLTAFFENVSGFGTPGAIVPLLLISMGFPAHLSVSIVLLLDGLFALSGAVGTPVAAGLEIPLELNYISVGNIYMYSSLILFVSGFVVVYFINKMYSSEYSKEKANSLVVILYLAILIPFVIFSYKLRELSGLLAAVFMAMFVYVFLFKNKKLQVEPWTPYLLLVFLLILPKLLPLLAELLVYKIEFNDMFNTKINAHFQPLKLPLIPFLISAFFALYKSGDYNFNLKPVVQKTGTVFLILFPSLIITQLMMNSGGKYTSIIDTIASVFIETGYAYPLLSPLLGALGAFVSGSTTVSNVIFGTVQYRAAQDLNLNSDIILSLQLVGASLGNAICLFNIIAACAIVGIKDYSIILKNNILPVLYATIVASFVGYVLLYFF